MSLNRAKKYNSSPQLLNQRYEMTQWLKKRGKQDRIVFNKQMIDKLSKYFHSLDEDRSNTISANELQDPLILFGLCQNREDVDHIFKAIDIDKSGQLDFHAFLQVFRRVATEQRSKRPCKKDSSCASFQNFTNTLLGMQSKLKKGVSFRLGISIYRRKSMLKAIMGSSVLQKQQGKDLMDKSERQVISNPTTRDRLKTSRETNQQILPKFELRKPIMVHRRLKTVI